MVTYVVCQAGAERSSPDADNYVLLLIIYLFVLLMVYAAVPSTNVG